MAAEPIDDIETWSKKLSPWQQDCLRRLAISTELSDSDFNEILSLIKHDCGLKLETAPPAPIPFTKVHFGHGTAKPIILKGIANVENVNRLTANASLTFCPKGLTVIYGRNGSGKNGFVRILRTACRTRIENPAKIKVLGNVYGGADQKQAAQIIIDLGSGDIPIEWASGMPASPDLMQIGVFDTASAQLYVDSGSQIRYLPFGLALPHRLNTVCINLKERLAAERATAVGGNVDLTKIAFPEERQTRAQSFEKSITKNVSDTEINEATGFGADDQKRLDEICRILGASAAAIADLAALLSWTETLFLECESAEIAFASETLDALSNCKKSALSAREAATIAANKLFVDDPLAGVATETWRALWVAARNYSVSEAYVGLEFPVITVEGVVAACVLCQQPLLDAGAARMNRFREYMDNVLDAAAEAAEQDVQKAMLGVFEPKFMVADEFGGRLDQIRMRDKILGEALAAFRASVIERHHDALARLSGGEGVTILPLTSVHHDVKTFVTRLTDELATLSKANDVLERDKLVVEQAELEDQKILTANRTLLMTRRNLLLTDAAYAKALSEVQTKGITQRANDLLDKHLTAAVAIRFNTERAGFDIMHLNIGLTRKSGQTKAEFEVDTQTKLTRVTSDVLSEGEQRALALAGFLTEVALTDGSGPIVVDDPVSSLDRDRSIKVADRLADESCQRQVIVFTHDIIFFNDLCHAADSHGIEPVTVSLFSDKNSAGKIDPSGVVWKGLNVAKRIGRIKSDFAPLIKLSATSPADYEYQIKNLYGRLRDTYERVVEEVIFHDVVRRGVDAIQTQKLRYVTLSDPLAVRFHQGMTKSNTYSHDNPAADTVPVPTPSDFKADVQGLEELIDDLKSESLIAELARPEMKPKK